MQGRCLILFETNGHATGDAAVLFLAYYAAARRQGHGIVTNGAVGYGHLREGQELVDSRGLVGSGQEGGTAG